MCKFLVCFVCALLLSHFTTLSQSSEVKKMISTLCSPEFHGRGYVNGGDSIAAFYLANEFRNLGLDSLSLNYFQEFSFPVNTFPDKAIFHYSGVQLRVGEDILVHPSSPSYLGELHYKFVDVKTIIETNNLDSIVQEVLKQGANSVAININSLHSDTIKLWRKVSVQLVNLLPVIVLSDQKFIWSVSSKQFAHPLFEVRELDNGKTLTVNLDAKFITSHRTRNVIAYLPSKKATKKTIVFTAHYDHLGRLGAETYFPGANDNASGTATLFEIAKLFKKNPVPCNILFIAFAGEEIGLLGSKYYVEHPIIPLENMLFLINLDIVGSGEEGAAVVNGEALEEYFLILDKINKKKNIINPLYARGTAANSDHHYFYDAGVPAFFIYTMGINKHYHDIYDTAENLSLAKTNDLVLLLHSFTKKLIKKSKL